MTQNRTKIALLAVLIVSILMSGCIGSITTSTIEDASIASIQKSRIATDNTEYEEPVLTSLQTTPAPIQRSYHVQICAQQEYDTLIISVNGGRDFHLLKELRVLVNGETIDLYSPECQVPRKIGCTIIGDWKVTCEGTFEDGKVQELINTRFNGIPNPKLDTTIVPERYVEPTPTPTILSTPTPVITPTPTPIPTSTLDYQVGLTGSHISLTYQGNFKYIKEYPDEIIFGCISTRYGGWRKGDSYDQIEHVEIFVDDEMIASFKPTIIDNPNGGHRIMNDSVRIKLPTDQLGDIKIVGSFINLGGDYVDGEYTIHTNLRRMSLSRMQGYEYIYDYPTCDGIYHGK